MFYRNRILLGFFAFLYATCLAGAQAPRITVGNALREINARVLRLGDIVAEDPHQTGALGPWSRTSYIYDPDFLVGDAEAEQNSDIQLVDNDKTLTVNGHGNAWTVVDMRRPYYGRGIQSFSTLAVTFASTHPVTIDFEGVLWSLYIHWNGSSFASFTLTGPEGFKTIRYEAGLSKEYVPFSECCLFGPAGTYSLSLYAVSYCDYNVEPAQFYNWVNNFWELDFTVSTGGGPADGGE